MPCLARLWCFEQYNESVAVPRIRWSPSMVCGVCEAAGSRNFRSRTLLGGELVLREYGVCRTERAGGGGRADAARDVLNAGTQSSLTTAQLVIPEPRSSWVPRSLECAKYSKTALDPMLRATQEQLRQPRKTWRCGLVGQTLDGWGLAPNRMPDRERSLVQHSTRGLLAVPRDGSGIWLPVRLSACPASIK